MSTATSTDSGTGKAMLLRAKWLNSYFGVRIKDRSPLKKKSSPLDAFFFKWAQRVAVVIRIHVGVWSEACMLRARRMVNCNDRYMNRQVPGAAASMNDTVQNLSRILTDRRRVHSPARAQDKAGRLAAASTLAS